MTKSEDDGKSFFATIFAIGLLIIGITTSNEVIKITAYIFSGIFFLFPLLNCVERGASMRPRKYFREINEEV